MKLSNTAKRQNFNLKTSVSLDRWLLGTTRLVDCLEKVSINIQTTLDFDITDNYPQYSQLLLYVVKYVTA